MRHTTLKIFSALLLTLVTVNANATKLYKWVDANGNISYQDQPPPKDAKILSEREVGPTDDTSQPADPSLPEIVVYSVEDCDLCIHLVEVLNRNKIPHIERPLEDDRDAQSKILEQAGSISAPTVFIGDEIAKHVNGNPFLDELESAGYKILDRNESRLTGDANTETESESVDSEE